MRSAEEAAIAAGTPVERLMERAGASLAEATFRYAGAMEALILCGPGNNGGDGYVAARHLMRRGLAVRVAALADPVTAAAKWARAQWNGATEELGSAIPAPLVIDCLFGTGLTRSLDAKAAEALDRLCSAARVRVACDLPSGVHSDSGELLCAIPRFDLTVTFGALKPAHRLSPAIERCGRVVLGDIGVQGETGWTEIGSPCLPTLRPDGHKFDRGMVAILAGEMPGAAALASSAAARAGAGYVKLIAPELVANVPSCVVQGQAGDLRDPRVGALLVGPGLGSRRDLLDQALESGRPLVLDADALSCLGARDVQGKDAILTPHAGEFRRMFGSLPGSKADQVLSAAETSGAVVIYKGPDTLVAAPDGRLGFAPPAPRWLASAGTGDVLAGIVAAFRARGLPAWEAACAAVWVHGRAAESAGPHMLADDLVDAIPAALDRCR